MSAGMFKTSVPVDKIIVVKGPGPARLKDIEQVYSSEEGIVVTLVLKTDASSRTFERQVRAWDSGETGFRLLMDGWEHWCEYNSRIRTGEIETEHPDDKIRRKMREAIMDSTAVIARCKAGIQS